MKPLFLASILAAMTACTSTTNETVNKGDPVPRAGAVQMNDVSLLYPIATTTAQRDSGYLLPTSAGVGGPLLPEAVYDALLPDVRGATSAAPDYAQLRVTAVRLDPCFAQIGPSMDSSSCVHQIRLVFQPVTQVGDGPIYFEDAGFHALYTLSATDFAAAVDDIVALRVANSQGEDLGPLAVHPILARQGLDGAMAHGVNALVLKYAGAASLSRLTGFVGESVAETTWRFGAVDVVKGVAAASPIFGLEGSLVQETVELGTASTGLVSLLFPPSTTTNDLQALFTGDAEPQDASARQAALDSALRIENPRFVSPNTVDCVSCHVAQIAHRVIAEDFFKMTTSSNANAFVADAKYVSAADDAQTYPASPPNGLDLNIHAFSYDGAAPMIVQRVINETAAIVAQLSAMP